MKYAAVLASFALLFGLPASGQHLTAQHGSGQHAGVSGHAGIGAHSGFAPQSGFRGPSAFTPPGRLPGTPHLESPGFVRGRAPLYSGFRAPDLRHRYPYQPGYRNNPDRTSRYRRDHRRGDYHRRNNFAGAYGYGFGYPILAYPYPWVNSFTLSGWDDDSDYAAPDVNGPASDYAQAPPYPYPDEPYPEYNGAPQYAPMPSSAPLPYQPAPSQRSSASSPESVTRASSASAVPSREPLTLVFKDGRAPEKIQNYMMNGTTLTDLDPQHFAEIPLDQIDVDATTKLNRARGITFQVPGAPGE